MAAPGDGYMRVGYFTTNAETPRSTWVKLEDYKIAVKKIRAQISVINIRTELHKLVSAKFDAESDEWLMTLLEWGQTLEGSLSDVEVKAARQVLGVSAISATL